MRNSKASKRYAEALLSLAFEKNALEEVKADMDLVKATCSESHELDLLLHSPIIKADKKMSVLVSVFQNNISELSLSFLKLLAQKGREMLIIQIADAFKEAYRAHKGIVSVEVTSARPLSTDERKEIQAKFSASGYNQIELKEAVDASLIGGLKVRLGDRLIDFTILKQLHNLEKQVNKNSNISR